MPLLPPAPGQTGAQLCYWSQLLHSPQRCFPLCSEEGGERRDSLSLRLVSQGKHVTACCGVHRNKARRVSMCLHGAEKAATAPHTLTCLYAYTYKHTHAFLSMHAHVHIFICMHMHARMYPCTHVHRKAHSHFGMFSVIM